MKKFLWSIAGILVLSTLALYLFIPTEQTLSVVVPARANQQATYRALINEAQWKKWWPGISADTACQLNGITYTEGRQQFISQEILQHTADEYTHSSEITVVAVAADSVLVGWEMRWNNGLNPFNRWSHYRQAKVLAANMRQLLAAFTPFIENKMNHYGFEIREGKVKDTVLMATKGSSTGWPSVEQTYSLINRLKEYIRLNGAAETNYPMMHITDLGYNQFETMVGIPVNKILKETNTISLKRMVLGNILEGTVTGGYYTINAGLKQMNQYIKDYGKTPPAIPFQLLITDREKEPDTSKWVTGLYYPIF